MKPVSASTAAAVEREASVDGTVVSPRISDAKIRRLKIRGLTDAAIARRVGVSRQAITKRVNKLWVAFDPAETSAYTKHEVLVLDDTRRLLLSEMRDPEKLKGAGLRDLAVSFGIITDKRRLIAGQSTENLALCALVDRIERESSPPTGSARALVDGAPAS